MNIGAYADLSDLTKTTSTNYIDIGDDITYTLNFSNTGNVDANNIFIKDIITTDSIISGFKFIPGSIVSNVPFYGTDITEGITLTSSLKPGLSVSISFKFKLISTPSTNPIENTATIDYKYTVDPSDPNGISASVSTTNNTPIYRHAQILAILSANKSTTKPGDVITYTFKLTNIGNVDTNNILLSNSLPPGTTFVPGTVTINGSPYASLDPNNGINITLIQPDSTTTITFDVNILTDTPNPVTNQGLVYYSYISNPTNPPIQKQTITNTLEIPIIYAGFNIVIVANKTVVLVGDTLSYNISVANSGNIDINNIIITDNLPNAFKVESIYVDGVVIEGDITTGINIGTIKVGQNSIIILNLMVVGSSNGPFKNIVNASGTISSNPNITPRLFVKTYIALSEPNITTDTVTGSGIDNTGIIAYNPSLELSKSSNSPYVVVGDKLTYTIVATNNGDVTVGSLPSAPIKIYDILSPSLEFIKESVTVNGASQPTFNLNKGIDLQTLNVGQSSTITFDVIVLSNNINQIDNVATSMYGFSLPGLPIKSGSSISNVVSIIPEISSINIVKVSDKKIVSLRDTLTYTVTLTNNGTLDTLNVIFNDILPPSTSLVKHTFTVDGVLLNIVDLSDGVDIGNIPVNATKTIQYTALVTSSNCSMKLINSAYVNFRYIFPNRTFGYTTIKCTNNSTAEVNITITNFKQFIIEGNLTIPAQKPNIESINNIRGSIQTINYHVAQTALNRSLEGQYITGSKLIVNGILKIVVEYTACKEKQGVYSTHYNIPFSTFIVLPETYCLGNKIEIDYDIEDIYNNLYSCRNFFVNTTALINVKIICCNP